MNYYNEFDSYAAQWLRNLIAAGHIAPGVIDTRSIEDVRPNDLAGFAQCHFFAGVGVWSLALRRVGWPDDRPVWTGSCPCQPFSATGAGDGFDDERHLWPAFYQLIGQRRPPIVVGEQVASRDADPWIDLVCADLEAMGYAFGAVPFPSAGLGAPHIRDRLYWVADANGQPGDEGRANARGHDSRGTAQPRTGSGGGGGSDRLDHPHHARLEGLPGHDGAAGRQGPSGPATPPSILGGLGHTDHSAQRPQRSVLSGQDAPTGRDAADRPAGPTNGLWRAADWLLCRDGKWRPVEPGTFPLVDGPVRRVGPLRADWHAPAGSEGFGHRAGRLKGYGNAINLGAAVAFLRAAL